MQKKLRIEIISIDSDRLAEHAFDEMTAGRFRYTGHDMVAISATPVDGGTLLAPCAGGREGTSWWFRSRRDLDRIFEEMTTLQAMFWNASRVDDGVLLNVGFDRVNDVIVECQRWLPWVRIVTSDEVAEGIAGVKREIELSLVQLQRTGYLSTLNKTYKAFRTGPRAEGEKIPNYKTWATAQLEKKLLQLLQAAP